MYINDYNNLDVTRNTINVFADSADMKSFGEICPLDVNPEGMSSALWVPKQP
jgi:hypothetical protein